jgi:aryl-alcohol dehydrogenase-like predicted oxidoreductase
VTPEDAVATIRRAIDMGCNFFDSAEAYNQGKTENNNEQVLGEAIKAVPRESVVIATKVG